MKTRVLLPELMDNPDIDRVAHIHALLGLQRINTWTSNASLAWRPIAELAKTLDTRSLRVLDIATGAADVPIGLSKRANANGINLVIDACDISGTAIEFAATNCAAAKAAVRLFQHDVLQNQIADNYDVVMCSQFLHHLTEEQARQVLVTMAAAATHRVVVIDLVRSRLNWLQVWIATRVLTRSKVVHFDGPQSIRAAFTADELEVIARRCDFASVSLRSHWPSRMALIGVVAGND